MINYNQQFMVAVWHVVDVGNIINNVVVSPATLSQDSLSTGKVRNKIYYQISNNK